MLALLAKYKVAVIVVALLGALGIGGAGVAAANGVLPNPLGAMTGQDVSLASIAASASGNHPGALRRLLTHGSIVTSVNGEWVTYTLDVGQVAKISDTSITLTRLDGQQVTLSITPSTVWGNHRPTPAHPTRLDGRRIVVFSQNGVATQIGAGNGVLKNAIHLDLVLYRNGQNHEIQIDRGTAQSVSVTQISVRRADGVVVSEPVATKARWIQAPHHTTIQPSQVSVGARVAIVTYNGSVIVVRLPAVATLTTPTTTGS